MTKRGNGQTAGQGYEKWLRELGGCTCGRLVIEDGKRKRLEAAWDERGEHVVIQWFWRLLRGAWGDEPGWLRRLGVGVRLEILADLSMRFEEYCNTGTLRIPRELNELDKSKGLLEIKVSNARVPIFDCTEYGTTRCTHGFYKKQQSTPRNEINRGLAIMRADKSRDN